MSIEIKYKVSTTNEGYKVHYFGSDKKEAEKIKEKLNIIFNIASINKIEIYKGLEFLKMNNGNYRVNRYRTNKKTIKEALGDYNDYLNETPIFD